MTLGLRQERGRDGSAPLTRPATPSHAWPLAGRKAELNAINAAVTARGPGGFVLSGTAGIGKTRVAREVVGRAESANRDTEWVAASRAAASIPFGAVSRLLAPDALPRGRPFELLRCSADGVAQRGGFHRPRDVHSGHL